ncbi:hypothetical protein FHS96_001345 [Sphingomonas zeicaulis]|uniref:hypothetical protein n=1 Tax=Sphingomonas zeicaulis TaxID=1632740 RepID=UPI003D1D7420
MGKNDDMGCVGVLTQARALMVEALRLLDGINALAPGAHLDLAIHAVDQMLGYPPANGPEH